MFHVFLIPKLNNAIFLDTCIAFPLQNFIDGTHSFVSNTKNEKYYSFKELISIFVKQSKTPQ